MASILIRNIDDNVHAELKRQAKALGRSTEAEARRILVSGVKKQQPGKSAAELFDDIRKALGGGIELDFERSKEPIEPADLS